mmetsp:Transcript_46457/g.74778  ORF Transcript_46457/g.74778 Transcript_46457/m.74778 type:complete len:169 (-) Transcript_46457:189-695(-)
MSHVTRIYLPHISMSHVTYVQPIAFEVWSNSNLLSQPHEEGMEAKLERKKTKRFVGTQPKKRTGPGQMAQTPRAGTGVSACKSCVVGAQLCLLAMAIFPCVVLSCALTLISVYYCQPQKRERKKKKEREFEHLVISHPNSNFLYQELVQSWFASDPSSWVSFQCTWQK